MANYVLTPSAVRKLRGVLAATPGNSGATGASSPVSIDDFPLPFTVRWSASAAEAGAWIIWLPNPERLVMFDGVYSALGGITAAQSLPAGWYTLDGVVASSGEIWLSITVTKSDSGEIISVAAALSAAEKQSATGETVYNIVVAEMITATATGAKRVKQFVDSAVIIGGESGDFIPPFTVRWSETAWVIWLPDPAQLVMFDGSYTTIGGITAAPALPTGWYTIDGVAANSGKVWLVITVTKLDSGEITSVSAALSAAEKQAATGETVYNIVVADLSAETKSVKQFVDSAVILGGTSSSGESGDTPGEDPTVEILGDIMYDISDHQLKKRIDTVNLKTGAVVEGNYVMIVGGQATPHTGEIS